MKYFSTLLLIVLCSGCASRVRFRSVDFHDYREPEDPLAVSGGPAPLLEGERLVFAVSWRRISVGELIMENHGLVDYEGSPAYHLSVRTRSNRFLSRIYRIENEYHTWMCAEKMVPLKFENTTREGRRRRSETIVYDHDRGRVSRESRGDITDYDIPPGAQNYFSLIYWVRGGELLAGGSLETVVNDGDKNWDVSVNVLELGAIESEPLGMVSAFALEPRASHQGEELEEATIRVWVSNDRRRLPLAFEVNARIFGRALAVLDRADLPPLPETELASDSPGSETWVEGRTAADPAFFLIVPPLGSRP